MKKIWFCIVSVLVFVACSDDTDRQINGQWQLRTVDVNGVVSQVDTVFYSFQRGMVFSFAVLLDKENTGFSYGYVDFPSDKEITISMDTTRNEYGYFANINWDLMLSNGWEDYEQTYVVESLDGKNMVLSRNQTVYSFRRY